MEQNQSTQTPDIRNRILKTATKLFAEKGFEGTSIRDIAKEAQVNLAMVSYYFGNKEGLYLECISNFAKSKITALEQMVGKPTTKEEFKLRFRMIIESKMKAFTEDLDAHKIIMREMQTQRDSELYLKFVDQLEPIFRSFQNFFQHGIDNKIIKPTVRADLLTTMLMGIMSHPCIAERAMRARLGFDLSDEISRDQYTEQICELFFAGVLL